MIRLFVAIDLPQAVRDRLWRACCDVPGARWIEPGQMHLTLRFVGEVDELGRQRRITRADARQRRIEIGEPHA